MAQREITRTIMIEKPNPTDASGRSTAANQLTETLRDEFGSAIINTTVKMENIWVSVPSESGKDSPDAVEITVIAQLKD